MLDHPLIVGGNFNPKKCKFWYFTPKFAKFCNLYPKRCKFWQFFPQIMLILTISSQKSAILDNFPLLKVKNMGKFFHNFYARQGKSRFFWQIIHLCLGPRVCTFAPSTKVLTRHKEQTFSKPIKQIWAQIWPAFFSL